MIRVWRCPLYLTLDIVHGESVEELLVDNLSHIPVKKLKALKFLYDTGKPEIDSTFLATLEQLQEIHLNKNDQENFSKLFEQKQRYNRPDLKIYAYGLLLDSPSLAAHPFRLADKMPLYVELEYTAIESGAPGTEMYVLRRFPDLSSFKVDGPVQDIERFLGLLKNFDVHISELRFLQCAQPQELFDRLPEHSALQCLTIHSAPSDFKFLFLLKDLTFLLLDCSIDIYTVRKILEELPFLSWFQFRYLDKSITIQIRQAKEFWLLLEEEWTTCSSLNVVIQSIVKNALKIKF